MTSICKVDWCDRKVRSLGYCSAHYQRARRGADMNQRHRVPDYPELCTAKGCDRLSTVRGYCRGHYERFRQGCDIDGPLRIFDPDRGCRIEGCDRKHKAHGYCRLHWSRARGDTSLSVDAPIRNTLASPCDFTAAHVRVRTLWGPASRYRCIECGENAKDWAYDGTDPAEILGPGKGSGSGSLMRYSLYPEFYMPMCRKCHVTMDRRKMAAELREYRQWKYETGLTLADVTALQESAA